MSNATNEIEAQQNHQQWRAKRELSYWILDQPNEWLFARFTCRPPAGSRLSAFSDEYRHKAEKAFRWTMDDVTRRTKRRERLKCVPAWGGDDESGVYPHIHAMVELVARDDYEFLISNRWEFFVKKIFGATASVDFYAAPYDKTQATDGIKYITRYEGNLFGRGTDKIALDLTVL